MKVLLWICVVISIILAVGYRYFGWPLPSANRTVSSVETLWVLVILLFIKDL